MTVLYLDWFIKMSGALTTIVELRHSYECSITLFHIYLPGITSLHTSRSCDRSCSDSIKNRVASNWKVYPSSRMMMLMQIFIYLFCLGSYFCSKMNPDLRSLATGMLSNNIVVGRVSATSTTARWSSRVGSTEHPESRSYLSDNSEGTIPYRTVNRQ